jgi:hypothetical protein
MHRLPKNVVEVVLTALALITWGVVFYQLTQL